MGRFVTLAMAVASLTLAGTAFAVPSNKLVLNEANCVTGDQYLEVAGGNIGTDSGPMIGTRLQGNGNNWLELLVVGESDAINHTLDIRNWKIEWVFDKKDSGDNIGSGTITFNNVSAFSAIARGTLLTISEFKQIAYDTAVDSSDGSSGANGGHKRFAGIDGYGATNTYVSGKTMASGTLLHLETGTQNSTYHKHFWAGDTAGFAGAQKSSVGGVHAYSDYFTFTGDVWDDGTHYVIGTNNQAGLFVANNDNWAMRILDGSGTVVMDWVGEDVSGYSAGGGGGVGKGEVFKLQVVDVAVLNSNTYDYATNYAVGKMADGKESTMASENKWSAGTKTQNLTSVR